MCHLEYINPSTSPYAKILHNWPPQKFIRDFYALYPEQIPNVAILLMQGHVEITRNKDKTLIDRPAIIAMNDVIDKNLLKCSVFIRAGSIASLIDRASLLKEFNTYKVTS